jgi:hypothetical protein
MRTVSYDTRYILTGVLFTVYAVLAIYWAFRTFRAKRKRTEEKDDLVSACWGPGLFAKPALTSLFAHPLAGSWMP